MKIVLGAAIAAQSVELTYFYVCPVCSPTRSSLMTGRYNYRTGIVDTFLGRSLMDPRETTLPPPAELFFWTASATSPSVRPKRFSCAWLKVMTNCFS